MRTRISHQLLALTSASLLTLLAYPQSADACGGLFCGFTPVVQAEEAIVFDVDLDENQVTAIINIVYQGSAEDFVWVLPLQTAPESIETGSQTAFQTLARLTQPQHFINDFEDVGMCSGAGFGGGRGVNLASGAEDSAGGQFPAPPADPGVNVVSRQNVGPYDTVVLEGTNPEAVKDWLLENGYRVTDEMMEMVTPYIAKGDTLLALKLLNDKDVGEIKPIEVLMRTDKSAKTLEACIPIRMTAMAANTDMPITAYIFSDHGRAIPKNFFHVVPNQLKIDWLNFGSNYRQVIADAVDEADAGHAFVTERLGSPDFLLNTVYDEGIIDLARLRNTTDLGQFLEELMNMNLLNRPGMQQILTDNIPAVADCLGCRPDNFRGQSFDRTVIDIIDAEIISPDRRAQEIFDRRAHFTRLFTMLDPDEMTVDPIFDYSERYDEINNVHNAKMIRYCGVGGAPGSAGIVIVLEDGRRIYFDSNGQPNRELLDSMPAAEKVEQLHEGLTVRDNSDRINGLLDDHNEQNGAGCGCGSAKETQTAGGALAGLLLIALGVVLRRKRS